MDAVKGPRGHGFQVREALHPRDLARMLDSRLRSGGPGQLLNASDGQANSVFPGPIEGVVRPAGMAKLKIQEMGSRYLFICLYLWREKHLSRGDYKKEAA